MIVEIIKNPTFHGGLIVNEDNVVAATKIYEGKFEVRMFKETLYKIDYGLLLARHNFLFVQINDAVARLSEGGIMQRWVKMAFNRTSGIVEVDPQVLTMDHLMMGFQIWLSFLILASILFLAELFRPSFERLLTG